MRLASAGISTWSLDPAATMRPSRTTTTASGTGAASGLTSVAPTMASGAAAGGASVVARSEEHTSELQSLMRISYAVFCLKKKTTQAHTTSITPTPQSTKHTTKHAT